MTYRTNAKPLVRRRLDWGALGQKALLVFVAIEAVRGAIVVSDMLAGKYDAWEVAGLIGASVALVVFFNPADAIMRALRRPVCFEESQPPIPPPKHWPRPVIEEREQ